MASVVKRAKLERNSHKTSEEYPSSSNNDKMEKKFRKQHATDKKHKSTKHNQQNKQDATSWDVDKYKTDFESEEHWQLKRKFILAHKDKFSEEKLICLAQAFINIEFMGCKYPAETMRRVGELSQEVAKEFRAERAQRLKRTFISASDAAEQRAKGWGKSGNSATVKYTSTVEKSDELAQNEYEGQYLDFGTGGIINLFKGLKYPDLVLFLQGGRNCLRRSAARCHQKYEERDIVIEIGFKYVTEIRINEKFIAMGEGETKKAAKLAAYKSALDILQSQCYSIKLNKLREIIKIEKKGNEVVMNVTNGCAADSVSKEPHNELNKGYHMMCLMGWNGGGLGANKQGCEQPVSYLLKNGRLGFGAKQVNWDSLNTMIENYKKSDDIRDLQFVPSFTKEERSQIHNIAQMHDLRSQSYGSGASRHLVITKKFSFKSILEEVLLKCNPTFCNQYFVQVPESKVLLFPKHTVPLQVAE